MRRLKNRNMRSGKDKRIQEYLKKERGISMKFLHISDLHIGKRVNEFSMIEDQKHILRQILGIA